MKKTIKRILKILLWIILIPVLYVGGTLLHGTITDFRPEEKIELSFENSTGNQTISDSTLTFAIWNMGYGGLGEESNFFFDNGGFLTSGGKMVRAPQEAVEKNIKGATDWLAAHDSLDFLLLQEVDFESKRSYKINQYEKYKEVLPKHSSSFSVNFRTPRVPLPVLEPWNVMGKMESGLGTFSKYDPSSSTRFQLPGEHQWPDRLFHLDRCAAFYRYPMSNGKELIVVNIHNSAYDKGGVMKAQQNEYLRSKFQAEYDKGNYLVIGGDWNQRPAGQADWGKKLTDSTGKIIPDDYFADWTWAYDTKVATNRALKDTYQSGSTPTNLIDFFLVSPNLEVTKVQGVDMDFKYSDHQPVLLEVKW